MLVAVLLDTEIHVHYGFLNFCSAQTQIGPDVLRDAWRSQTNGLVGAAVPEVLIIRTETHTGQVRVQIELHDAGPELADDWAEVVEVDFASWVDDLTLIAFDGFDGPVCLPPGGYRVRYAARAMPAVDEMSVAEHCLLQFWPAADTDRVVRQSDKFGVDLHARGTHPPWTAAELASRVQQLQDLELEPSSDVPDEDLPHGWPYHHLIRSLGDAGQAVGYTDPALAAHLTTADPATLRVVACWAADQALTITGIRDLPWVDEALTAARRGDGLPPGLAGLDRIQARIPMPPIDPDIDSGEYQRIWGQRQSIELLHRAAGPTSMETTCSILQRTASLSGGGLDWLVTAVRRVFPHLVPAGR